MPDPTPLSPQVFQILIALSDGERHGYAIMQEVESQTEGQMRLGPGTLYGSIKRILEAGWISERENPDEGERRRYYALTNQGQKVLKAEAARLASAVKLAQAKKVLR